MVLRRFSAYIPTYAYADIETYLIIFQYQRLAIAAGLTVGTTAGSHNFDFVKSLGATYVFDHKDPNVITSILKILKEGDVVYDVIGSPESQDCSAEVLSKIGGGVLATVRFRVPKHFPNVETTCGMSSINQEM